MELFSLVLINLLFCGMMYVFISAKVQKAVSEYYDKKLNRAIDMATQETIRELDATVAVIESKMVALRAMMERGEVLVKEFKHYQSTGLSMKSELIPEPPKDEPALDIKEQRTGIGKIYQANQIPVPSDDVETTEGAVNQAFGKLGKAVKGIFGMEQMQSPSAETTSNLEVPTFQPKMNYTVGGNPFTEEKSTDAIRNELAEGSKKRDFLNEVSKANDPAFASYQKMSLDKVELSIESALEELAPSATKIDKVVHLIKKGYKHEEISEAMNIGIHEIHLIETIRLDRSRRI
ncbi:hypothetical protein ND861_14555 [Leptospira sp. 2 VSF19]|uniref:Uncharacterized protein n=1 Tax=Leptospira soteropolitanensis TaxID=2950025 RepID=A0AAW5VQN0_9LEPT|nr:hypothetical protein [Leptospira soteropolitanensis]MCW7493931.1 hypothetical protein [Leptospira soteropolitanensis]MCW7501525.1 hypothetical protein [Leptospira soteropolitanensis]MCW7523713.1 hypothetical protein [Leptospira soteropolitanensis]MCW7527576.1 hypothetical protein [Leptospira soteropolitanensis]MCW7531430.1 hypothetical protein [Leptospira soteropolitanensis]